MEMNVKSPKQNLVWIISTLFVRNGNIKINSQENVSFNLTP